MNYGEHKLVGREEKIYDNDLSPAKGGTVKGKTRIVHPRVDIDANQFESLKNLKVGDIAILQAKIKKTGESLPYAYEHDQDPKITLELVSLAEEVSEKK